jgi:predicted Zn-dependent protease
VAVISLLLVGVYGVPEIASRLAPYVPYPLERRLGDVVETQVRSMLDPGQQGQSFECGWTEAEKAGRAALNQLVGRLETAAALPIPLRLVVVRKKEANAMALPGGHIYIFEGLITRATSPDEVAGVIAHEIGHVANRDGMRSVLQAAGLSFLFGLVLGDFVGGGAVIIASKTILQLAYSREVEGDADRYALDLMAKAGGDGRALGTMLERISGAIEPGTKILLDHPATKERVMLINAAAGPTPKAPMLDPAGWAALRRICAGS